MMSGSTDFAFSEVHVRFEAKIRALLSKPSRTLLRLVGDKDHSA
jgi:hypothetical protein